jgi:hypothetical protein
MIRLIDILKEVQQDQQVDEGWKDVALRTAMTAASVFGGAKAQSKVPTDKPAITTTKQGTSVDGIIGQFTSQFKFPKAFDTTGGVITDLGFEGNTALRKLRSYSPAKMKQWNKFRDWMHTTVGPSGKVYAGDTAMDHANYSRAALDRYKKEVDPNFFIKWLPTEKKSADVEEIQDIIKAYRVYTVADWKSGDGTAKGGHSIIAFGPKHMDPKNPDDVKRVDSNYMMWAKD